MASSVSGFDYKWDQSIERKHIKKAAFHKQIHEAMKEFKGQDHLAMMFPDLAEFIKGLFPKKFTRLQLTSRPGTHSLTCTTTTTKRLRPSQLLSQSHSTIRDSTHSVTSSRP